MELNFGKVDGLPEEEQGQLNRLQYIYKYHQSKNRQKRHYYDGKIELGEVNLGLALPSAISRLKIGCAWGAKTVDVLAARSMFDGFVSASGADADVMTEIAKRNRLIAEYRKACTEELKYGCAFAAISGAAGSVKIRFYSPQCAAASWDNSKGYIDCGFVFEDLRQDESDVLWSPSNVIFHTETAAWELIREGGRWTATPTYHNFGRPLMVPLTWNATNDKPLGQSRLNEPVRRLIQGYVRTIANATIGLEFATAPQKYILGVTDDQYDVITGDKFKQYVGSIIAATVNPETGEKPTVGQFTQGSIQPHVEMIRILATQFSAATGLPVTDTGVVNDANPTSSDAILAQTQTLVSLAEQLNASNGDSLYEISQLAQAIELGTTPAGLFDDNKQIIAHFKNPAMPSVAVMADASIKISSVRPDFAKTDTFLEMNGFDQAETRRIKGQEQRQRGLSLVEDFVNANNNAAVGEVHTDTVENQSTGGAGPANVGTA